jgi:hypothetical protein
VKKILGGILMAMGIIIATLTGLCSAFFIFSAQVLDFLPLILLLGLLPCAGGVGLFFWGRALVRRARERESESGGKQP